MKKWSIMVLSTITGGLVGTYVGQKLSRGKVAEQERKADKFKLYYNVLVEWMSLKQNNKTLSEYFKNNNYSSIAIYGMGELGLRLYEELKNTEIDVKYAIDKNDACGYVDLVIKDIDEDLEKVDAIIVTPLFAFDEIENDLSKKVNCPVISLEEVVFNN